MSGTGPKGGFLYIRVLEAGQLSLHSDVLQAGNLTLESLAL